MAEIDRYSYPNEYDRPPVYRRPYLGIVRLMEKVFKDGQTVDQATPTTQGSTDNG